MIHRRCLSPGALALLAVAVSIVSSRTVLAQAPGGPPGGQALDVPPPPPPPPAPAPPAPPPISPRALPTGAFYAPPGYGAPSQAAPPQPFFVTPPPPPPTTSAEKDTYSGHVLLADGLAFGTIVLGAKTESGGLVAAGIVGYLVGGPLVHGAHGRGATAGASLGLRVLTPLLVGGVFYGLASSGSDECNGSDRECGDFAGAGPVIAGAVGGFLGAIAAPILDASLLARREWFDALPVVPTLSVNKGGGGVGLGGVF